MGCSNCKEEQTASMPFVVHEAEMARTERYFKKLWAVIIILLFMLIGTNLAWLYYESQFQTVESVEETTQEYEADASDGGNAIINGEGSVSVNG